MARLAVVAVGGNALITDPKHISFADQQLAFAATARHVADLVQAGYNVCLTHGNGPQVGFLLLRSQASRRELPEIPLDVANAMTQAEIGYLIQQSLDNEFARRGLRIATATVVTQVVVDENDPAFANPSKPVGPFYTRAEAQRRIAETGWTMIADAGRGQRRVVPSPRPHAIVEKDQIQSLLTRGTVVVAVGGGGIPVVVRAGALVGVPAVIDKDLASALLAVELGAELLLISTQVERVCLDYRTPTERPLDRLTVAEAERYLAAGQFPAGSMGPKIEAALGFLHAGGRTVIITDPDHIADALGGRAGTRIEN